MNRVVLSGWIVSSLRRTRTSAGTAQTHFRLRVPRYDETGMVDEIDCVALRGLASELALHAHPGDRLNLEGQVRVESYRDRHGHLRHGPRVHADFAYLVLPSPGPPAETPAALILTAFAERQAA